MFAVNQPEPAAPPVPLPGARRWLDLLRNDVDRNWRPGQWNHEAWLFTAPPDDPSVTVSRCQVKTCDVLVGKGRLCKKCARAFRASSLEFDEFTTSHSVVRLKEHPALYGQRPCSAKRFNVDCPRVAEFSGLCRYHYHTWRREARRDSSLRLETWLATGRFALPVAAHADCLVRGCDRESRSTMTRLCSLHHHRFRTSGTPLEIAEWAKRQAPYIADHQFTLIHLDEQLRWEVLHALQQRDARGGRIDPLATRAAIRIMAEYPSLATISQVELDRLTQVKREANANAHLVEFARHLRSAHDELIGRTPKDHLVWDLVDVGLKRDPTPIGGTRLRKGLDFGVIKQPWLREATMAWAREQTSLASVTDAYRAAVIASNALDQQPDRGLNPVKLSYSDADVITEAINRAVGKDGTPYRANTKRHLYRKFFALVEWARLHEFLDNTPMSFGRRTSHGIPDDRVWGEDIAGKAIPIDIQRQLDANMDSIGDGCTYGTLSDDQRRLMFTTIYVVLRDTGRRTLEVASLKTDCLAREPNGPIMIYDNHKAGRLGRRLPILQSTADTIGEWRTVRATMPIPDDGAEYLFPGATPWQRHLNTQNLARALRTWISGIDRLDTNELNQIGQPVPFDRMRIHPYAFRHTYAQRHADNGTPIDVLRDLLDHKSIQTTGCYYVVTADRKRKAIKTVGKYTVDRNGAPATLTNSTSYQMRSVAVPFGNCVEPSNVKAGGHACPIRFQCAGCGFYRPDPSYIPAIEEHLNSLRSDREIATAIDAAAFVIDNLNAQITSFEQVLTTMRERMDRLDVEERTRVEEASITLRRARAGTRLPLSVINHERQESR